MPSPTRVRPIRPSMPGSGTLVPPVEVLDVVDELEPPEEVEVPPDDEPPDEDPPLDDELVELVLVLELELLPPQFFEPAEWPQRQ